MNNFVFEIYVNFTNFEPYGINLNSFVLFFILITSFISQLGDLIISYFKRTTKIKDTGKILPGHGGLFDRLDSHIAAFPCFILLLNILSK